MSKIVKLTAENVKRLRAVEIVPAKDGLVVVGGANGQGKTSVLDAIAMALGGARFVPTRPIRDGASKGKVHVELDDLIIERTFTAAGGGGLIVKGKDGVKLTSPQAVLDKLTGAIAFDPFAFYRMEPRAQAAELRMLSGVDVSALDAERKSVFEDRTIVNRDVDRVRGAVASMPARHEDVPEEEVSATEVWEELKTARAHNKQLDELQTRQREAGADLQDRTRKQQQTIDEIEVVKRRLEELDALLDEQTQWRREAEEKLADATKAVDDFTLVDEQPIADRLALSEATNQKVRENVQRAEGERALADKVAQANRLTVRLGEIDSEKEKVLRTSRLPVKGLAFTEDGVTYRGIPLEQASGAERLRISMAIALAGNPELKVCLIRDGSLLDDDSLAMVARMAEEAGAQVWLERVGEGAECQVIIEDGSVRETREAK